MLKKQMEMFEEGGLKDDGGTVDPISGNDVPSGSTQEEVRDDIPAQLSEGEFVFPADVVRYIGLQNLMQMRQQAKMGLKEMEDMGQMGNSEEATMPDDMPFDINDIDMQDEEEYNSDREMAKGGVVYAATGFSGTTTTAPTPLTTKKSSFDNTAKQPYRPAYVAPEIPTAAPSGGYTYGTGKKTTGGPGFDDLIGDIGVEEYRTYINDAGAEIEVPFLNGKVLPSFTVPEGYKLKVADKVDSPKIQSAKVKSAKVEEDNGESGDTTVSDLGGARTTIGGVDYAVQYNFDGTVALQSLDNYKDTGKTNFQKTTKAMGDMIKAQALGQIAQIAQVVGLKGLAVNAIAEKFGTNMPGKNYIDKMKAAVTKGKDITKMLTTSKEVDIFGRQVGYDAEQKGTDSISGKEQSSIQKGLSSGVDTSKQTDISEKAMQDRANKQAAEQRAAEQRAADARDAQRAAAEAESRPSNDQTGGLDDSSNVGSDDNNDHGQSSDDQSGYGGGGWTAKGGFIDKRKIVMHKGPPKKNKMMKRGGLASRK